MLHVVLVGYTPFDVDTRTPGHKEATRHRIRTGEYFPMEGPAWEAVSEDARVSRSRGAALPVYVATDVVESVVAAS